MSETTAAQAATRSPEHMNRIRVMRGKGHNSLEARAARAEQKAQELKLRLERLKAIKNHDWKTAAALTSAVGPIYAPRKVETEPQTPTKDANDKPQGLALRVCELERRMAKLERELGVA